MASKDKTRHLTRHRVFRKRVKDLNPRHSRWQRDALPRATPHAKYFNFGPCNQANLAAGHTSGHFRPLRSWNDPAGRDSVESSGMAMGRPQKPYQTSWNDVIPGIYRCPRWPLEDQCDWSEFHGGRRAAGRPEVPALRIIAPTRIPPFPSRWNRRRKCTCSPQPADRLHVDADGPQTSIQFSLPETDLWAWVRRQLIARPDYVAQRVGIPEMARLRDLTMRRVPIKLSTLIEAYERDNPSLPETKKRAVARFKDYCGDARPECSGRSGRSLMKGSSVLNPPRVSPW